MSYYNKVDAEIEIDVAVDAETTSLTATDIKLIDPMNSGFVWYTPPLANDPSKVHTQVNDCVWNIAGHDMQVLTMTVSPQEQIVTEVGSFMFGSKDIELNVELTLCTKNEGCDRICGGESCVKLLLKNNGPNPGYVGITPNFVGKIIPIQFGKHIDSNHALLAQSGSYMTHLGENVKVGCDLDTDCGKCCCGGFGLCRQKITGTPNDIVFLSAGGTLIYRKLEPNEVVIVDTRSIVAIEESVQLGIKSNGQFCTCCCGGEGCFSTTLTGPGKVFLQSMSFTKFKEAVQVTVMEDRGTSTTSAQ